MPAMFIAGSTALQMGGSIFSGLMGKSVAKKQEETIRIAQGEASGVAQQYRPGAGLATAIS